MEITFADYNSEKQILIKVLEKEVMMHECGMIKNNDLAALLPVSFRFVDEWLCMDYNAGSRKTLAELYKDKHFDDEELSTLVNTLFKAQEELCEYLLSADGLLLEPDYIFVDGDIASLKFCYVTGKRGSVSENIRPLLHFFIDHVDYTNQKAVAIAYGLFQYKDNTGDLITSFKLYTEREVNKPVVKYDMVNEESDSQMCAESKPGFKEFIYRLFHKKSKKELIVKELTD